MNTELKILKKIFQGKEKTPIRLISNYLGYGLDYIRFICKKLKERDLIREVGRDWYRITQKGKKELERKGLIRIPVQKRGLRIKKAIWKAVRMKGVPAVSKNIKLKPKFEKIKEEKLKIGKKIEKIASFLGELKIF